MKKQITVAVCLMAMTGLSSTNATTTDQSTEVNIPVVPTRVLRPDSGKEENRAAKLAEIQKYNETTNSKSYLNRGEGTQYRINGSNQIFLKPGENVFVPIAINHPNRFITPFKNPNVVSTTLSGSAKTCGEICVRGNVVYISTDKTFPVTAFITEKGREDIAMSITMLPKQIPPREVKFSMPDETMERLRSKGATGDYKKAQAWENSLPYVTVLRTAFREIALQRVPQGYTLTTIKPKDVVPLCKHPGLKIDFKNGQKLEGYNLDIYVGVMENVADSPVEFREQLCGGWRVAAVTSWPLKVLQPKQKTEIYMALKRVEETEPDNERKPLIAREYN